MDISTIYIYSHLHILFTSFIMFTNRGVLPQFTGFNKTPIALIAFVWPFIAMRKNVPPQMTPF